MKAWPSPIDSNFSRAASGYAALPAVNVAAMTMIGLDPNQVAVS
jgi:hypothetical protein